MEDRRSFIILGLVHLWLWNTCLRQPIVFKARGRKRLVVHFDRLKPCHPGTHLNINSHLTTPPNRTGQCLCSHVLAPTRKITMMVQYHLDGILLTYDMLLIISLTLFHTELRDVILQGGEQCNGTFLSTWIDYCGVDTLGRIRIYSCKLVTDLVICSDLCTHFP